MFSFAASGVGSGSSGSAESGSGYSETNEETTAPCGENVCINTVGSFQCQCPEGFININNECVLDSSCTVCSSDKHCMKENDSTACKCRAGYKTTGEDCEDINECEVYNIHCDDDFVCRNDMGTYSCVHPNSCDTLHECNSGYGCVDGMCQDIDECEDSSSVCPADTHCSNTEGGYNCNQCDPGYKKAGENCVDVDECVEGKHNCHAKAKCINKEGSFKCACLKGYTGDGNVCLIKEERKQEERSASSGLKAYGVVIASVFFAYIYHYVN